MNIEGWVELGQIQLFRPAIVLIMDGLLISPKCSGSACIGQALHISIGQITEMNTPVKLSARGPVQRVMLSGAPCVLRVSLVEKNKMVHSNIECTAAIWQFASESLRNGIKSWVSFQTQRFGIRVRTLGAI